MRRLSLILSDLYLPAEADRDSFPVALELPSLDWLLRQARSVRRIADWRRWLALDLGASSLAAMPPAHLCRLTGDASARGAWLATPVQLEARLDHVRMTSRGLLQLSRDETLELADEFLGTFGPGLQLAASGQRDLLLQGGPDADIRSVDPARLLDSDIGRSLPSGPCAGELRRLSAEIEMWLPDTRVNAARERAGRRRITALWIWGGGLASDHRVAAVTPAENVKLFGGDSWLGAFANKVSPGGLLAAPGSFAQLAADASACVELAPVSQPAPQSLADLEASWFAPARAALSEGRFEQLRIVANDRVFEIGSSAGWRWWRRRRSWLQTLGA